MDSGPLLYLPLILVVFTIGVNAVSALLWLRLLYLVRNTDEVLGFETASKYANYLFGQVMDGKFFRAPTSMVLGNPKKDRVIRTVTGSSQYETVAFVASIVKNIPVNLVPFLVWTR